MDFISAVLKVDMVLSLGILLKGFARRPGSEELSKCYHGISLLNVLPVTYIFSVLPFQMRPKTTVGSLVVHSTFPGLSRRPILLIPGT